MPYLQAKFKKSSERHEKHDNSLIVIEPEIKSTDISISASLGASVKQTGTFFFTPKLVNKKTSKKMRSH